MARYVWIAECQVEAVKRAIQDAEKRPAVHGFAGERSGYEPDRQRVERERDQFEERKRADVDALKGLLESVEVVAGRAPIDDAADAALERARRRDAERSRNESERAERRAEREAEGGGSR